MLSNYTLLETLIESQYIPDIMMSHMLDKLAIKPKKDASMDQFTFDKLPTLRESRIVAVGIGDSGSNIINHMINEKLSGIELTIANQNSYEDLRAFLTGTDVIFIVTGLGGNTSTVNAPIIAKLAKEVGVLTIGIVSMPFSFEGRKRREMAERSLETLKNECDSVVVISNDKLLSIIDPKCKIKESFRIVDNVFANAIKGISGVIMPSGNDDINLDFSDLQTVMAHRGVALIGIGESQGQNAAYEAINSAMELAMIDSMLMQNPSGVLVHFDMHQDFDFMKISATMEVIHQRFDESVEVIFGTTTNVNLPANFIRITVVAAGIEKIPMKAANNVYQ